MAEQQDVYRRLQQHLDRMPIGFPATASGVEIRILKRLFTPEDAEIALELSAMAAARNVVGVPLNRRDTRFGDTLERHNLLAG